MPHPSSPLIAWILCGLHILIIVNHIAVSVGCGYLFGGMMSSPLHVHPVAGCRIIQQFQFYFWGLFFILFFIIAYKFASPQATCYHFVFLVMTLLTGVRWCLTAVLIGISLTVSDVEEFSCTCLVSDWAFISLTHFKLTFVYGGIKGSNAMLLCMYTVYFPSTIY